MRTDAAAHRLAQTRLALAIVDGRTRAGSRRARRRLAVVAQRRAAGLDRIREDLAHCRAPASPARSFGLPFFVDERRRLRASAKAARGTAPRRRRCCRARRSTRWSRGWPSAAPRLPREAQRQIVRRQLVAGRLDAEVMRACGCASSSSRRDQHHEAEAARVVVGDARRRPDVEARHGRACRTRRAFPGTWPACRLSRSPVMHA